ncbi:fluoride efflux transporter CrcB [Listeria valentina]|uniref:fluoride efflux transporter CrcB n=1 Tax=Listeria valentina TaxID=2705293 RepID=UPI00142F60E3|nr:fluoride efflux transporter CrcB [Listeria valentina]
MYLLYIAIFSALGGMARYGVSLILPSDTFPLATLAVNLLGCFLLALITQSFAKHTRFSQEMITAMGTGFVGSFTTFSSFSVENIHLLQAGAYAEAFLYIAISLIGGLAAAALGYKVSKRWDKRSA